LPRNKIEILLKVFGRLKQKVIMKWETDELEGKPENVMIMKWLPQDDILAHPQLKIFISHCGLGSIVEAKYHAVPVIAFPIFADQETNANVIVGEGWALKLNLKDLSEEALMEAIQEILRNQSYSTIIKNQSRIYRDRPMNARETAAFWVEYVIRNRGAAHMQSQAVFQNFFIRNSLDVVGFILLIFYATFKLFCVTFKMLLGKKKRKIE
jgi:glucuronosyltransferase